jgi:hypothetical protein
MFGCFLVILSGGDLGCAGLWRGQPGSERAVAACDAGISAAYGVVRCRMKYINNNNKIINGNQ